MLYHDAGSSSCGRVCLGGLLILLSSVCRADSITVQGVRYDNVYVREGGSMYYVQLPEEGRVISFAKTSVDPKDVVRTGDVLEREKLRVEWKERHSARLETTPVQVMVSAAPVEASSAALATAAGVSSNVPTGRLQASGRTLSVRGDSYPQTGMVGRVSLKNVPLGQALKAVLRSSNLDYSVENGYLWVSTPEKLRTESFEDLETRFYEVKSSAVAGTLPKIVLRNPAGGAIGAAGYGGGYGGTSGAGGSYAGTGGGYGGYGNRQSSYGAGGTGMTGGQSGYGGQMSGGQMGGGYGGGMGGGMGGYGGGMGGGYGGYMTGPHFSNISDLFTTIDDRLVGETPAVIGLSGVTVIQGQR